MESKTRDKHVNYYYFVTNGRRSDESFCRLLVGRHFVSSFCIYICQQWSNSINFRFKIQIRGRAFLCSLKSFLCIEFCQLYVARLQHKPLYYIILYYIILYYDCRSVYVENFFQKVDQTPEPPQENNSSGSSLLQRCRNYIVRSQQIQRQ